MLPRADERDNDPSRQTQKREAATRRGDNVGSQNKTSLQNRGSATLVRVDGIEPTRPLWKSGVLPLNYTRMLVLGRENWQLAHAGQGFFDGGSAFLWGTLPVSPLALSGPPCCSRGVCPYFCG